MRDSAAVQEVWAELPSGYVFLKHYSHGVDLVECQHAPEHRYEKPSGAVACRACMGDEFTTANFTKFCKRLVKLDAKARTKAPPPVTQEALF